jgi:hypothetical protein
MRNTIPAITTLPNQLATRNIVARTMPQKPNSGRPTADAKLSTFQAIQKDKGTEQNRCDERQERDGEPSGDERAEPEGSQHDAEEGTHRPSLWRRRCRGTNDLPAPVFGNVPRTKPARGELFVTPEFLQQMIEGLRFLELWVVA